MPMHFVLYWKQAGSRLFESFRQIDVHLKHTAFNHERCEILVACENFCENGGICSEKNGNPTCDCLPNFYGANCEYADCDSESCQSTLILANTSLNITGAGMPKELSVVFNQRSKPYNLQPIKFMGFKPLSSYQLTLCLAFTHYENAFDFEANTGIHGSCGSVLNDMFYVIGGYGRFSRQVRCFISQNFLKKIQISRVENCQLKRIRIEDSSLLPISFVRGTCATFMSVLGNSLPDRDRIPNTKTDRFPRPIRPDPNLGIEESEAIFFCYALRNQKICNA